MIDFRAHTIASPIEAAFYQALLGELVWHRAVGDPYLTIALRTQYQIGAHREDFALWLLDGDRDTARLVVECDGREFHDAAADRVRDGEIARRGWHVLRFTGAAIHANASRCAITALATLDALASDDAALRAALGVPE